MLFESLIESAPLLRTIHSYERQRHLAHSKSDQPAPQWGNDVVVLLGHAGLEDVKLGVIQADTVIEGTRIRCTCFGVWQKDLGWAVFQNDIGDIGVTDIAQLLRGHHDYAVHAAECFQPVAQSVAEEAVTEVDPRLIQENQGGRTVEALLDLAEEVQQNWQDTLVIKLEEMLGLERQET